MSDNETVNQTSDPWEAAAKTYKARGAPSTSAPVNPTSKGESDPWEAAAKTYKSQGTSETTDKPERGSGQWYKEKVEGALEPTTADVSPDSGVIRSQLIAPAKTLGREVYSAGKTV